MISQNIQLILPEIIFSMIINEYKKIIEKEYIIDETFLNLPKRDYLIFEMMKVSLESIGLMNIIPKSFSHD